MLNDIQDLCDAAVRTPSCDAATSSGELFFPVMPGKEEQVCHGKLKKKLRIAFVKDSSCRLYGTDPAAFLKERTQRRNSDKDLSVASRSDKSFSGKLFSYTPY